MVKLTVFEKRALTIEVDTDDKEFAKKIAVAAYEDASTKDLCYCGYEVCDGGDDTVDMKFDRQGECLCEQ